MFHVTQNQKTSCSTAECLNPCRPGQRDCKECHAAASRIYRRRKSLVLAKKALRLAELEELVQRLKVS
jgi:hypothetical protein